MYTFIIIFAIAAVSTYLIWNSSKSVAKPEPTPSESSSEEPLVVESPVVVVDNKVVKLKETKTQSTKKSTPKKRPTSPPKAKK